MEYIYTAIKITLYNERSANKFLASYQYIINLGPFHNQHFTINTTYTEIIAALGYIVIFKLSF